MSNRNTQTVDDEGTISVAGENSLVVSLSTRRRELENPFAEPTRRLVSASAAAGEPDEQEPAAFIALGTAVAAVVMKLRYGRPRVRVLSRGNEG
ncbi:hypothetical protein CO670_15395 [Rhizobium sp. J15]|uniref:hypothetical protein n=1 Tax=Rhizobium sp. J15 TaxID=2035450 RepID=UPI000BE9EB5D|nr:hypothetical protein [Rhizobium sp. J15]PDT15880.1 hypothetical protein CO670_15395 [Rhizobium sp. J15]